MDSRRTDSTESAAKKMTSFNASTPPVASAVATTACAVLGVTGAILHQMTFSSAQLWSIAACMGAYVAGGYGPTLNAFVSLLNKKLNVDLLMVIAAIGAAIIGDWIEGVVLLFLFSLSGTLEAFAIFRTNQSIESLVQLRPREAWLVLGGNRENKRIPVESLQIDDVIRIRSGERFSVDGVVTEGETWVDEATLTGESELIHKQVGEQVFSGTINGPGSVLVRMTKAVNDTTLERIVHMVQEAQAQKTPAQRLVESWQQPYVIGVLTAASLVFFGALIIHTSSWYDAFYHSMVLLVAA